LMLSHSGGQYRNEGGDLTGNLREW
jgi:hypothetical protein